MNKYFDLIKAYIDKDDISRNNANLVYSLPTLNSILSGAISKDFWLDEVYQDYKWLKARDLYEEWWIYFHNLSILWPYCAGWSAKDIATKWLNSIAENNISTRPPKYYRSLLDQCANFICVISQEIHWACAINDLTAIVASYIWYDEEIRNKKIDYNDLVNAYESFIYAVNTPFRAGNSPFTNITINFDWDPHLKDEYVVHWWNILNKKYKDIPKKYLNISNKAFIDAMKKWDASWKPFTFPLITVNIYDDFDRDNIVFKYLLENMDKWWWCYFENYQTKPFEDPNWKKINPYIQPKDASNQRSFCCRFKVDFNEIIKAAGGNSFRSNAGVWWIGVFNINLNRLAYISLDKNKKWNKEKFFYFLDIMLEAAQHFAQKRRKFIEKNKKLYPYFFYYNRSLDTYFNVISIVGWHEALINLWYEKWLNDSKWRKIAHEISLFINKKIDYFIKRDKVPVSLEYAPSENWAPTLAKKDLMFVTNLKNWKKSVVFPDENFEYHWDIFVQGNWKDVFLTSGFQPPYQEKNIWMQIQISAEFQSYASWGSVQHFFIGEKIPLETKIKLIKTNFSKPVNYITITPTITICDDCKKQIIGEHLLCPYCNSTKVMISSRIIWYLRPIASKNLKINNWRLDGEENYWQDARRADWATRKQTIKEDIELLLQD